MNDEFEKILKVPTQREGAPLRVHRPRSEADHSPPSSAVVRNGGAIPTLPHTYSWRGA
jgi:hypothetical protein